MQEQPVIAILLPTYNGAQFIQEQLASILQQSYPSYLIVARDDGSSDATPQLLANFAERHPERICLIDSDGNNLGACGSFSFLVNYVLKHKQKLGLGQAYMAFCDQDDIWLGDKLEVAMAAMLEAEAGQSDKPVLVHGDLEVVDEYSEPIAPSLASFQGLETDRNRFPNMVISNLVTGCTALINEDLANRSMPVSSEAIMHDWWLALVASAFGEVVFLDRPLVRYRQHASNTIGAKEFSAHQPARLSFWRGKLTRKANEHLMEVAVQAAAFRQRYGVKLGFRNSLALRLSSLMRVRVGLLQRVFYRLARRI